ncbi:replication-relaxation family protein [Ornithinibacillus sp. JPR2-1]|uniref:replication-relaxation family protein n=1 Tax=Ornithinibacillus sp. JPR2-1 TaxID=2094019 RepID=UPI0031DD107A
MIHQEKRSQREERILLRLADLNFATRKQLQVIENLGGERNARRILYQMEKDKSIKSVRQEQKIYYLSNKGRDRIGISPGELKRDKIKHTLMLNDLFIQLGQPKDWRKEFPVNRNGELYIIPDALYTESGIFHFVEIDNVQTMKTNLEKVKKYKDLFSDMEKQFHHKPVLIWYSLSPIRKEKLKIACKKANIKFEIY